MLRTEPAVLRHPVQALHEFFATLLGQGRDRQPDDLAVVGRIETQVRGADGLFNGADLGDIPRLDGDERRLGNVQVRELVQRRRRPVIVHADVIQNSERGAPGPDVRHLVLKVRNRLLHSGLEVGFNFLDGVEGWTSWELLAVQFS